MFMIVLLLELNRVAMNYLKTPKYLLVLLWKFDLQVEKIKLTVWSLVQAPNL